MVIYGHEIHHNTISML